MAAELLLTDGGDPVYRIAGLLAAADKEAATDPLADVLPEAGRQGRWNPGARWRDSAVSCRRKGPDAASRLHRTLDRADRRGDRARPGPGAKRAVGRSPARA